MGRFQSDEPELIRAILDMLRATCGNFKITIAFDGGGDSGYIEDIVVDGLLDAEQLKQIPVTSEVIDRYRKTQQALSAAHYAVDRTESWAESVYDFLEDWAGDFVSDVYGDWYNNDGASGSIVIAPFEDSIRVEVYERYYTTRLHEYALEGGRIVCRT